MSRTDENMVSIYERKNLFLEKFKEMECSEEDQFSSSITHIKNLTTLTLSKYCELNGQTTLSGWKKSSMPNQLAYGEKTGQI
ncbi:hypothetical protein TNCV_684971 [Trichonephila clavipes]|nr:hypothetical protein TNCV_684971 [Trichonephila clavipes]